MTPREFVGFFKTRSGKLVVFGLILGGNRMLFSALRQDDTSLRSVRFGTLPANERDKPQVVQSVERDMDMFRPPQPKPETTARSPKPADPPKPPSSAPKPEPPTLPAPITLFADR